MIYGWILKGVVDMEYITVQQAAENWNISDRRVRTLCQEGKIKGVTKHGKSYRIPEDAAKPVDGRRKPGGTGGRFLKWDNEVIGIIDDTYAVTFIRPDYNKTVALYTQNAAAWTPEQFTEWLSERTVSRDRRDIEKILFRCGLSHYDVLQIARVTRGIHPKDLLWIANREDELLGSVVTNVFDSVFHQHVDLVGDSIDTPEGYNIKRYGVHEGLYGIYKHRISPLTTDVESEVAVYLLAERLGVPCCPAYRTGKDVVFSAFLYDFAKDYIVHFRRLFDGGRSDDEYLNLVTVRPQYQKDIARMILLDFITRQDDRHLSNIAIKVQGQSESFYPLYDNGRSLFYEDTEEMVALAIAQPERYATGFGYSGTYWDYVQEIARGMVESGKGELGAGKGAHGALEPLRIRDLIDLDVSKDEIADILQRAGFLGYRFEGALEWISKCISLLRESS